MAYERHLYRDPADIVEWDQSRKVRNEWGCAKCQHMDETARCTAKQQPGPRGYCPKWRLA